jgi:WD40 repeat protein
MCVCLRVVTVVPRCLLALMAIYLPSRCQMFASGSTNHSTFFCFCFVCFSSAAGVLCVDVHPDQAQVVSGGNDCAAVVFNRSTGKITDKLEGHKKKVTSVKFHPTEPTVFTTSADHTAVVWSNAGKKKYGALHTITCHKSEVVGVTLHPTGAHMPSGLLLSLSILFYIFLIIFLLCCVSVFSSVSLCLFDVCMCQQSSPVHQCCSPITCHLFLISRSLCRSLSLTFQALTL